MVPTLIRQQRRVTLCLCTDSIPTDPEGKQSPHTTAEFLAVLGKLFDWPVQVVLRLSTTDERVRRFYRELRYKNGRSWEWRSSSAARRNNSLYSNFTDDCTNFQEHFQILEDYVSECEGVREHNPWLHYGYPLHLCREEGICIKAIESLSQRPLNATEVLEVTGYLFGEAVDERQILSNTAELRAFRKRIVGLNKENGVLWSPIKKKFVPWIDLKQLDKIYFHQPKMSRKHDGEDHKCTVM
eukprot:CAMPEP_0178752406 /NCGR_PEP_ID=MMETSP0744-20121128/11049_1 /TAXON_ID=913974 /ORGANISM="Nitzschia punctata, Strain CCMP561" /LENGTH=240 /DNA_ID=CAMNT_0020406129 /DNA_START=151 /DNA_END=873 /DNA_ORIENTATION=+